MNRIFFYTGLSLQLFGMASVGICLLTGLNNGDYGKIELVQFVGGATVFYLGSFFKNRQAS